MEYDDMKIIMEYPKVIHVYDPILACFLFMLFLNDGYIHGFDLVVL